MPFFTHPANADWLLPLIKLPLLLISAIFWVILNIGIPGTFVVVALVIALFARNVMGPART